jgi:hypothetical protein
MQEISLSSMLMFTAEIAWQQMHSSAVSIVEHDSHSHLKWLEQLLNKLMQITSPSMSWEKALYVLKRKSVTSNLKCLSCVRNSTVAYTLHMIVIKNNETTPLKENRIM